MFKSKLELINKIRDYEGVGVLKTNAYIIYIVLVRLIKLGILEFVEYFKGKSLLIIFYCLGKYKKSERYN